MAPESDIAPRIREGIAAYLKRDASKIRLDDDLRNDLGVDSLDLIELVFKIEETFDLEIPNAELPGINTVGDVITYVERRLGTPGAAPVTAPATPTSPGAESNGHPGVLEG